MSTSLGKGKSPTLFFGAASKPGFGNTRPQTGKQKKYTKTMTKESKTSVSVFNIESPRNPFVTVLPFVYS